MWKPIILDVECIVCNKTLQKVKHDPRDVSRKMVRIANKRSRTPNWSSEEKQHLLELIRVHKEVVVTKSNNGPNQSEEKDIVWNEILRQLADKFGNKFTGLSIKKVKTQWQNMKRIAREEVSHNGSMVQKYSKQSLEVYNILDLDKEGIPKKETGLNDTTLSTNIEIKTECIDEDTSQLSSCSNNNLNQFSSKYQNVSDVIESSSSNSEPTEVIDEDIPIENLDTENNKKSTDSMTEPTLFQDNATHFVHFGTTIREFLKYSVTEKELKLESLKEERQVFKAMRETAELNKIIAEEKVKHILWMKNRELS